MIFVMTNELKSINRRYDEDCKELKTFKKEYEIEERKRVEYKL